MGIRSVGSFTLGAIYYEGSQWLLPAAQQWRQQQRGRSRLQGERLGRECTLSLLWESSVMRALYYCGGHRLGLADGRRRLNLLAPRSSGACQCLNDRVGQVCIYASVLSP